MSGGLRGGVRLDGVTEGFTAAPHAIFMKKPNGGILDLDHEVTKRICRILVWGATTALVIMPQLKYFALRTNIFDLGQFTTFFFNVFNGDGPGYALRTHANLFIPLYAVAFAFFKTPVLPLLIQSAVLVFSSLLFRQYWRIRIGDDSCWVVLLYFLLVPVWYSALFDFHFEHLLFLFLPLFFVTVERPAGKGRDAALFIIVFAICAIKEVYALTAVPLGIYLMFRHRKYALGTFFVVFSLSYFLLVTMWLIPAFTEGKASGTIWGQAFGYLGSTPSAMGMTILRHPLETLEMIFSDPRKLRYILILGGMFIFLPFFAPLEALVALPALTVSLLSQNPNHYAFVHQYSVGVTAPLLVAFVAALASPRFRKRRRFLLQMALAANLLFLIMAGPSPVSLRFWKGGDWSYAREAYWPDSRDREIVGWIEENVPEDPQVSVSIQNSLNTGYLTARKYAFAFPEGVFHPAAVPHWGGTEIEGETVYADYVVLDLKRPWFVSDQGCGWVRGVCRSGSVAENFLELVSETRELYETVFEKDAFFVLKRRGEELQTL